MRSLERRRRPAHEGQRRERLDRFLRHLIQVKRVILANLHSIRARGQKVLSDCSRQCLDVITHGVERWVIRQVAQPRNQNCHGRSQGVCGTSLFALQFTVKPVNRTADCVCQILDFSEWIIVLE